VRTEEEAPGATAWGRHEYDLGGTSVPIPGGPLLVQALHRKPHVVPRPVLLLHSATQYGVIEFPPETTGKSPAFSTVPMKGVPVR
jgi:hypothetical protein